MDNSRPLLSTSIIEKLTKAIAAVGKPSKRVRSAAGGTPAVGSAKSLVDLDVGMLSRTLKLLGRSVKLGEDLEPFAGPPAPPASAVDVKPKAKKKASKSKKPPSGGRQKSKTPSGDGDGEAAIDGEADAVEITDEDVVKVERSLQMAKESVIAANSCLALLSADKLPKQVDLGLDPWMSLADCCVVDLRRRADHKLSERYQEPVHADNIPFRRNY